MPSGRSWRRSCRRPARAGASGNGRCVATPVQHGPPPLARFPVSTCRASLPQRTDPGASVGRFRGSCCLPRSPVGSASTTSLSRPAQASHTLRPTNSLDRPGRHLSQGFDPHSCPSEPPAGYRANRPLPGWDFHPQGDRALRDAPERQINKLKMLKRAMYGRAGIDLLRARMLPLDDEGLYRE
jgi:hypothetical protein